MRKDFVTSGQMIKAARLRRGFSQRQLGVLCGGVSTQFVSNLERGVCPIPSDKLEALSTALALDVRDMARSLSVDYYNRIVKEAAHAG